MPHLLTTKRFWKLNFNPPLQFARLRTDNDRRALLSSEYRQRDQSALVEAGYLGTGLVEVEQASIGCDFTEVGAELIRV